MNPYYFCINRSMPVGVRPHNTKIEIKQSIKRIPWKQITEINAFDNPSTNLSNMNITRSDPKCNSDSSDDDDIYTELNKKLSTIYSCESIEISEKIKRNKSKCDNVSSDDDVCRELDEKLSTIFSGESSEKTEKTGTPHVNSDDDLAATESDYDDEIFEDYDEEEEEVDEYESDMSLIFGLNRGVGQVHVDQTKTFTQKQLQDIERKNAILMQKILKNNRRKNNYTVPPKYAETKKVASATINRRKQQEIINKNNMILLKKLQSVKPAVNNRPKK